MPAFTVRFSRQIPTFFCYVSPLLDETQQTLMYLQCKHVRDDVVHQTKKSREVLSPHDAKRHQSFPKP